MRQRFIFLFILLPLFVQGASIVYLEHSQTLSFDQRRLPDAQILRGDVRFRHDDALMVCDSAYFYEKTNSLTAMGNVRFEQGDTLHGFGDILYYNGETKLARLRRHVRLIHTTTTLTTDSLNYDRTNNLAYYFTGGTIQDSTNLLSSIWGEYSPSTYLAKFRDSVHLQNESFTMDAERLNYNVQTNVAFLVSPTVIVYQGETSIYSSNGWYNTATEQSMLLDRSEIHHVDGKQLTGDTIFYDKKKGYGQLLYHLEMRDTTNKATLFGNYGEMWEAERRGFATDSAMLVDWSQPHYTYIHADSLFTEEVPYFDTVLQVDTTFRQARAFRHVRAWSKDYQLVCDSLSFNGRDSLAVLHFEPILWSEKNQISADSINIYFKDGKIDYLYGVGNAFAAQMENPTMYNQLSGKEMYAYIRDNELKQVDVNGNAETVFFPKDNKPTAPDSTAATLPIDSLEQESMQDTLPRPASDSIMGCNKTQSSFVQIFLEDSKIHHILFTTETTGTMYPLSQIDEKDTYLFGFFWAESERPKDYMDIFSQPQRTPRPIRQAISASEEEDTPTVKRQDKQRNKQRKN